MCTDSLQQSGKGAHKNVLIKKKKKTKQCGEKKKLFDFSFCKPQSKWNVWKISENALESEMVNRETITVHFYRESSTSHHDQMKLYQLSVHLSETLNFADSICNNHNSLFSFQD